MKAQLNKTATAFQPIKLVFTIENQDDLDIFGGLANSHVFGQIIKKAFPNWGCPLDYKEFSDLGVKIDDAEIKLRKAAVEVFEVMKQ